MPLSFRASRFLLFFFCHELIVAAYFFQFAQHLEPCPLCIIQRVCFALMAVVFLLAAIHNPAQKGRNRYNVVALLPAIAGVVVAARHTWLQHLPADEVPTCGPGLNYLLDTLPLSDVFEHLFRGSGQCAEIKWAFLSLSMPEWTLLIFSGFVLLLSWSLWRVFR